MFDNFEKRSKKFGRKLEQFTRCSFFFLKKKKKKGKQSKTVTCRVIVNLFDTNLLIYEILLTISANKRESNC